MISSSPPLKSKEWAYTMVHNQIPVLSMSLNRPQFPTAGKTARIERYFNHLAQHWITRWKGAVYQNACRCLDDASENGRSFHSWNASLNFTVTYWSDPIVSIRLDAVENSGNAKPYLFCMGETWDCSTGYPRTLRSFFPAKCNNWKRILLKKIKEQADTRLYSGESLLSPDCTAIMERTFDQNQFYLTENEIIIFYPLYILGSYAEGIPVFSIPIELCAQGN